MPNLHDKLTPRQALFCKEFMKDLNGAQAAVRAGYSESNPGSVVTKLFASPLVAAEIERCMAERTSRLDIDADKVLREMLAIAMADPNEIVEHRRECCRHCWGFEFGYQRTPAERAQAWRVYTESGLDTMGESFDELGGADFDMRKEPNEDCPECGGNGVGRVIVKDTRTLSFGASRLYAGVKQTKDGIEIKMHDKSKHLELLAKHLGLLNDKVDVTITDIAKRIVAGRKRAGK